ncbi:NAD-dependent epimerase/dehydratase family protein [Pontibacillus salicampi]|uniref:NAD-dependent epimerase/dehydratase family protein n=1 Tax=Pontibacillus salicampi TaxID=1449801 RepID=A0ABV6LSY3_9BACI
MTTRKKVLITGASGYTGQHAIKEFEQHGYEVIPVSRTPRAAPFIQCDVTKRDEVEALLQSVQPDMIVHLACLNHAGASWSDPVEFMETNALSTLYVVEAVRTYVPTCQVLLVGSMLQRNPTLFPILHPYGFSKSIQEQIGAAWEELYQLSIYFVNTTNLLGPGAGAGITAIIGRRVAAAEANGEENVTFDLDNGLKMLDLLDVRDAVRAYRQVLESGESGIVYEIGTGQHMTMEHVVSEFDKASKVNVRANFSLYQYEVGKMPDIGRTEALGWGSTYTLEHSIQDILHYYRKGEGI